MQPAGRRAIPPARGLGKSRAGKPIVTLIQALSPHAYADAFFHPQPASGVCAMAKIVEKKESEKAKSNPESEGFFARVKEFFEDLRE